MDTIFALSSGAPPAGIAVLRISGPGAGSALQALAGRLPEPRRATARRLRDSSGDMLDHAMVLWLPGPATATGEDVAELHLHGGRAVIAAAERALAAMPGIRRAESGEFTRRAFVHGRIDLAEAEGLADLLSAETEMQRRSAVAMAGGMLSRQVEDWREGVLALVAEVEAVLDFGDEDDVGGGMPDHLGQHVAGLAGEIAEWLERPRAEPLKEGFRVVLAGPPNSGKSSLFNALVEDEAAIVTDMPGTTRDVLQRSVAITGVPFTFVDTAGIRESVQDAIERKGIARARGEFERADLVLWLGPEGEGPADAWEVAAKCDAAETAKEHPSAIVSALTGEGIAALKAQLVECARAHLPGPGQAALNARQHALLALARDTLVESGMNDDPLIIAECLRAARVAFDRLTGSASTEDMLDALFGRFCIGK